MLRDGENGKALLKVARAGSANLFFKVRGFPVDLRKSRRVENTIVVAGADSVLWSLRCAAGARYGPPEPLSHCPTGPFGESQTPQNGVCASPIFIKFRGPEAHVDSPKQQLCLIPLLALTTRPSEGEEPSLMGH